MNSCIKTLVIALAITSLSACIDVEDNNDNSELVTAIQQQNDILTAQNQLLNVQHSVTLTGTIKNISSNTLAKNSSVTVKVGNNWSEPMNLAEDGSFTLYALPFNSEFTLIIQSNEQAFLSRTYYGKTTYGTTGVINQHIGEIAVSQGELKSFSIVDSLTNESILGLNLYAYSYIKSDSRLNTISNIEDYMHQSSYNETTGHYEIMLPKDIGVNIFGSLDLNSDGEDDYQLENSYYSSNSFDKILFRDETISDINTLYLIDKSRLLKSIELRISVIDQESNVLKQLTLSINDDENGEITSEFDDINNQYVFDVLFKDQISIYLPAFTIENAEFDSSTLNISKYDDNRIRVSTPVYSPSGGHSNSSYLVPQDSSTLNIVMQPKLNSIQATEVELVTKSSNLNANNQNFKVFYSQPIVLAQNSVELKQMNVFSVVRGSLTTDDLVLPGSTIVSNRDESVAITTELSLNNTLLTVLPVSPLSTGFEYQYTIGDVIQGESSKLVNINGDNSAIFSIKEQSNNSFDINSLKLDNNNYFTNGKLIKNENTAGELSNTFSYNERVMIIVPPSALDSLKSLRLDKKIVTSDNISTTEVDSWQIISNNQFTTNPTYAVSVAENENLIFDNITSYNVFRGTAYPDGKIYKFNTNEYLQDNTDIAKNNITFNYTYQTLTGEVSTGEITLAVK